MLVSAIAAPFLQEGGLENSPCKERWPKDSTSVSIQSRFRQQHILMSSERSSVRGGGLGGGLGGGCGQEDI